MKKRRVLFLCTGNSARSQMAEALVNHFLGERWQAVSAGTQPAGAVHPLAVRVMAEIGIDIGHQHPKAADEFRGTPLDLVITVCDDAAETCPFWLPAAAAGGQKHISFPDPARATGSEEERLAVFRQVRDDLRRQVLPDLAG